MALFGTRGGQPFYAMYQASKMPELSAPVGLSSYIQLNAKSSSGKSGKEKDEDSGGNMFPGTYGTRAFVNNWTNSARQIAANTENYIKNEFSNWIKEGKDAKTFFEREDVNQRMQTLQSLDLQQQSLSQIRPDASEDLHELNKIENIVREKSLGGDIATRNKEGIYMPMMWDNKLNGPGTKDELLQREKNRPDKIYQDPESGIYQYRKSELPNTMEVRGSFNKEAIQLLSQAKMSTSGGIGTKGFAPDGPGSEIVYLTHQTGGTNDAGVNAAIMSLSNQMSQAALQDVDEGFWANVRTGTAMTIDSKGNRRPLTVEEYQLMNNYFNGNTDGMADADIAAMDSKVKSLVLKNRHFQLLKTADVFRQADQDVTAGSMLFNRGDGTNLKSSGEAYTALAKGELPADNERYDPGTGRSEITQTNRTNTYVKLPNGRTMIVNKTGRVWNLTGKSNAVDDRKSSFLNAYKNGNPVNASDITPNGAIISSTGQPLNRHQLSLLKIYQNTGNVQERFIPEYTMGEPGFLFETPSGTITGQDLNTLMKDPKAKNIYNSVFSTTSGSYDEKYNEAIKAVSNYAMTNSGARMVQAESYFSYLENDDFDDFFESNKIVGANSEELNENRQEELERIGFVKSNIPISEGKTKPVWTLNIDIPLGDNSYLQDLLNSYTRSQNANNVNVQRAYFGN